MRLLIIGTLNGQLAVASQMAIQNGASVTHATDLNDGLMVIRSKGADLVMIDVSLNLRSFIEQIRTEHISTPIVACGIGNNADAAVAAIKAGAKEYVPLPPEAELIAAVLKAVADDEKPFIYRDQSMEKVVALAKQVAPSEASILITGRSGTGKEVMARFVHENSNRKNKQFISINCAAIPENLLESELFGHEKGAFTGAVARRVGKFEEADGGTLLLDEISEMDFRLQAKLLRAIQEREIDRVGSNKPIKIDIRIIATSNRNLNEEVKNGNFREDLMFRLNVVNLKIPCLKDRPEDLKVLADYFAKKYADINAIPERPLSSQALADLKSHDWPGNVRELENTIHRSVLLASGDTIGSEAIIFPDGTSQGAGEASGEAADGTSAASTNPDGPSAEKIKMVGQTVAEVEKSLIIDTLRHCLGNRTHAANILGISIRTLRNKLNLYQSEGSTVPSPGEPAPGA
jgi:DNA-binding NtrC family response regulator